MSFPMWNWGRWGVARHFFWSVPKTRDTALRPCKGPGAWQLTPTITPLLLQVREGLSPVLWSSCLATGLGRMPRPLSWGSTSGGHCPTLQCLLVCSSDRFYCFEILPQQSCQPYKSWLHHTARVQEEVWEHTDIWKWMDSLKRKKLECILLIFISLQ